MKAPEMAMAVFYRRSVGRTSLPPAYTAWPSLTENWTL